MQESFAEMLVVGGKSNSLGRANEVIETVLEDRSRLEELYLCLFDEDAWVRMRVADSLEKICRVHPEWIESYIDKISEDLLDSMQPSIQWHIAQIYKQVALTPEQKRVATAWLQDLLSSSNIDWIVAANAMDTLAQFVDDGVVSVAEFRKLLEIQRKHKSKTVVKRADKWLLKMN